MHYVFNSAIFEATTVNPTSELKPKTAFSGARGRAYVIPPPLKGTIPLKKDPKEVKDTPRWRGCLRLSLDPQKRGVGNVTQIARLIK